MANSTFTGNNDHRFGDLISEWRKLGAIRAAGQDAWASALWSAFQASVDNVIDTTKNKHGVGVDDTCKLVGEAIEQFGKKAVHERTIQGLKKIQSYIRQAVKVGKMDIDHQSLQSRTISIRDALEAADEGCCKGAFEAYTAVMRTQQDEDHDGELLSDEAIRESVLKAEKDEETPVKVLKRVQKLLNGLVTGEGKAGKDSHEKTEEALRAVDDRLAAFLRDEADRKFDQECLARGIVPDRFKPQVENYEGA